MKVIHPTAYRNPPQNLQVSKFPNQTRRLRAWVAGNALCSFSNPSGSIAKLMKHHDSEEFHLEDRRAGGFVCVTR